MSGGSEFVGESFSKLLWSIKLVFMAYHVGG